jgi:hypothetical protein
LLQVQRRTREEKKLYRRTIKEKEERLLAQTGRRRMPKGERDSGDATYGLYKLAKAKLKLIDALLSKPGPLLCWNVTGTTKYVKARDIWNSSKLRRVHMWRTVHLQYILWYNFNSSYWIYS